MFSDLLIMGIKQRRSKYCDIFEVRLDGIKYVISGDKGLGPFSYQQSALVSFKLSYKVFISYSLADH